jgi:cytochrome c-type biogenesis protein CcmF
VLVGSTALIISRLPLLRSQKRIDSMASREAVFLINNLLLVAMCVLVFWGTFFPLISELFTGTQSVLAAPWFDQYTTPLAVALVLFTGIGPLLAWRRISWQGIRRVFPIPTAAAGLALILLLLLTDAADSFWALAVFVLAAFTVVALAQETWRGAAARRSSAGGSVPGSIVAVATRNRRRYGGYIVHLGFVVLMVGIAASSSFESKRDVTLSPGESVTVEAYTLTYEQPTVKRDGQAIVFGAQVSVNKDDRRFATLEPTRRYYQRTSGTKTIAGYFEGEATSEVGLRAGVRKDFWVSIEPDTNEIRRRSEIADDRFGAYMRTRVLPVIRQDPSQAGPLAQQLVAVQGLATDQIIADYVKPATATAATFRVIVSPLVSWIWIGAIITILGALFAVWPARTSRRRSQS